MAKSIVSIGYTIPGQDALRIQFRSNTSLMDADIILFSPTLPFYQRSEAGNGSYNGKVAYGDSGSFSLRADIEHWKRELQNALSAGKTVFFLLDEKSEYYLDTGQRTYSGTGKNRGTTVQVEDSNNYTVLPVNVGVIHSAQGKELIPVNNPTFKEFFDYFKSYLSYKVYIENVVKGNILFTGRDKSKILGLSLVVNGGNLILLPYLGYEEKEFTEVKENAGKTAKYWTSEAVKFGNILLNNLRSISIALNKESDKTPPPAWAIEKQYKGSEEISIETAIASKSEKVLKIQNDIQDLNQKLVEAQVLKGLLYEQGKTLERSVIKALELLGYQAETYNDGVLELDQVIISPEGNRYIGECEGKDEKDIDITKFRQLLESMNADFDRDEVTEKAYGILFGNPQRFKKPSERALDFTHKCKVGAEREKIALIKTPDLFIVASYLAESKNPNFQKACRDSIHNNLGKIVTFPQTPNSKDL